jgi:hypothetical protein
MNGLDWRLHRPFTSGRICPSRPAIPVGCGIYIDESTLWDLAMPESERAQVKGKKSKSRKSAIEPKRAKKAAPKKSVPKKAKVSPAVKKTVKKAKPKPAAKPKAKPAVKKSKPPAKPAVSKKAPKKAPSKPVKKIEKKAQKTTVTKKVAREPKKKKGDAKVAPPSKSVLKSMQMELERRVPEGKRRKPRMYSSRSKLSSFLLGDMVVFRRIRDWSNEDQFLKMIGKVIAKGHDPDIGVNYIEVAFDDFQGQSEEQKNKTRRFYVK